ncbi:MAG TPA: hypothetical protein VKV40_15270 [Ktedonobacteraceae bacterium]|nr:hypothetical protein [Ktedonobacteraceae bacterium]
MSNDEMHTLDQRLEQVARFSLLDALFGRRSRRFGYGMAIPSGPLAHTSHHDPLPLDDLERALLIGAATGVTGWNFGIPFTANERDALSNYSLRLTGRTIPSAASIGTSELFFTDDSGIYLVRTRDLTPERLRAFEQSDDIIRIIGVSQMATTQISTQRLTLPREAPHYDEHNFWNSNVPGSTLFMPVGDVGEQLLALLAMYVSNGYTLYDDYTGRLGGRLEPFIRAGVISDTPQMRFALSHIEQVAYSTVAMELALICQNIVLMMQAIGLGGWMYTGIFPYSVLGAFADEGVPGLGFRFIRHEGWTTPNPIGLDGYYESVCPPYVTDMYEAAQRFAEKKFGPGGTYDPATGGPYLRSNEIKATAQPYTQAQIDCIGEMAQHIYGTYGRFPARYPTILLRIYAQAHHLELAYYDRFFGQEAYLQTHKEHMERWHGIKNGSYMAP